jgi:hypothetical protein
VVLRRWRVAQVANTPMDTDKIKIYGARVRTESMGKVTFPAHAMTLAAAFRASTHLGCDWPAAEPKPSAKAEC